MTTAVSANPATLYGGVRGLFTGAAIGLHGKA